MEDGFDGDAIVANIEANPKAATVLVNTLRQIENLPIEKALVAESLAYADLQGGPEFNAWLERQERKAAPPSGHFHVDRQEDILHLTIDRQHAHNAIDVPLRDALLEAMNLACLDKSIKRVELRAAGRLFGIGGELAEFGSTTDPATAHAIRMQTLPAIAAACCAPRLHVWLHGLCIGASLELAAFASRVVARRGSLFQLPELKMGLIPGAGGCVSLSRRIGRHRTALMVLSGRRIGVKKALEWGLVDAIIN